MSDSKSTYAFPEKLISLQTELYEIEREIRLLPDAAVVLEDGTVFRDGEVYSDELIAKRDKLWRDRTDTAEKILTHDFWATVDAADAGKARSALKHAVPQPVERAAAN